MLLQCRKAYVAQKRLFVDGAPFVARADVCLVSSVTQPTKSFLVVSRAFDGRIFGRVDELLAGREDRELSLICDDDESRIRFTERLRRDCFPYVLAIAEAGGLRRSAPDLSADIGLVETSGMPEDYRSILVDIVNRTMAEPFLDVCGPQRIEAIRHMHADAIAQLLTQPCLIFAKRRNPRVPVGYLSWKTDSVTWRSPLILSTHYVDGSLTPEERGYIHAAMFERLSVLEGTKAARIHALNQRSRALFRKNSYEETEFLLIRVQETPCTA